MTDPSLDISAALREAQLQRLEASLASKSSFKYQPQVEAPKDKDKQVRDGPLTVALQPLISTPYGGHQAPADVLGILVVEAIVSIVLGVLLAWFTTRLIIWFFSPARYRRDRSSEDGIRFRKWLNEKGTPAPEPLMLDVAHQRHRKNVRVTLCLICDLCDTGCFWMRRRSRIACVERGEKRPRHRCFLPRSHRYFGCTPAQGLEIEPSDTKRLHGLIGVDRVRELLGLSLMNRHPNIAFFGGTVAIAIMVMAAFANVANAGGCSYSKSKSADATTEEVKDTADKEADVEAGAAAILRASESSCSSCRCWLSLHQPESTST